MADLIEAVKYLGKTHVQKRTVILVTTMIDLAKRRTIAHHHVLSSDKDSGSYWDRLISTTSTGLSPTPRSYKHHSTPS